MGIDAEMLIKLRPQENHLSADQVLDLSVRMCQTFGTKRFFLTFRNHPDDIDFSSEHHAISIVPAWDGGEEEYGEIMYSDHNGRPIFLQDGEPEVAQHDEQFLRVHFAGRYYGEGYERGDYGFYYLAMRWLRLNLPSNGHEIWYGGDSSGVVVEHMTDEKMEELLSHYFRVGHAPYRGGFRSFMDGPVTSCPNCHVDYFNVGGGQGKSFLECGGCGRKVIQDVRSGDEKPLKRHDGFLSSERS